MAQSYNRNYSKYTLNENSFKKIDTELKAYCLGFLYADGNIYKTSVRIHIHKKDSEILDFFIQAFETTQDFRVDKNGYAILNVSSRKICEDLAQHGVTPNKTFKLKFPLESLSEDLIPHFMRGVVDGDGSFSSKEKEKSSATFNVVSNFDFSIEFMNQLVKKAGVNQTKILKKESIINPELKLGIISYSGYNNVNKIYKLLYNDANVFLVRKKMRAEEILEKIRQNNLSSKRGRYSKLILFHKDFGERRPKATYEGLKECQMSRQTLKKLISGEKKSHKGWILLCASKDKRDL